MKALLLLLALLAAIIYGFRLMMRLDHFMNTKIKSEDEDRD